MRLCKRYDRLRTIRDFAWLTTGARIKVRQPFSGPEIIFNYGTVVDVPSGSQGSHNNFKSLHPENSNIVVAVVGTVGIYKEDYDGHTFEPEDFKPGSEDSFEARHFCFYLIDGQTNPEHPHSAWVGYVYPG